MTSCNPAEEPFSLPSSEEGPQVNKDQPIAKELSKSSPSPSLSADRKRSACFTPGPRYLPHAGLLLFLPMLNELAKVDEQDGPLLRQLTSGVLLGAANLEQTKLPDASCLCFLPGELRWKSPTALRKQLRRLAARPGPRADLLLFNARLTGNRAPSYVFFDPHTKQYTGQYPVLYGWVASMKRVDPGSRLRGR